MPDSGLHIELDALADFLTDGAGQPLTITVPEPLKPANQRLMDTLGVRVEVRPVSDSPVDYVRRAGTRGRTMGHYEPGYELAPGGDGKPDWIDYRASVGAAERRLEAGEVVSRCWSCKTELDVAVPVHSPRCRTLGGASNGREALDEMDAGLPQRPEPKREVETVAAAVKWTRESVIAAIRRWALEHGAPPKAHEWNQAAETHPAKSTVAKYFGSWADAIETAGFPRPTRGGASGPRSSVREPKARETPALSGATPAEIRGAATPPQLFVNESPGPTPIEAGSRTDEQDEEAWFERIGFDKARFQAERDECSRLCDLYETRRDMLDKAIAAMEGLA